jgi:hypothetical protein
MDYSMPSSSSSLFNILQLAEDGSNWVTYKHHMTIALGTHGLGEYVDGMVPIPPHFVMDSMGVVKDVNGNMKTADEVKDNRKEVNEYAQKDSLVQQHIFSTITDRLMLQLGSQLTGATMWTEVKKLHEGKSALVKVDMCKCKGTSVRFLTSPIFSHSPPVHMYSLSSPLYHFQGPYL